MVVGAEDGVVEGAELGVFVSLLVSSGCVFISAGSLSGINLSSFLAKKKREKKRKNDK
ncbi:hypothetical protein LEP1GSC043_3457 [Leptospira weilii str. Ecochallenge]|uniref:Uncharacterized protein n=1 Tax=Leptospira weilii str. Ecochallenge TaxID=1049986 RepID=N1U7H3_9LEPT|nr:hypothetical protein LEP1GSC043_3457 [Leptospira weilii str. Ecochallenge]